MSTGGTPAVGLLPWGNVIEDFLEPTGMTLALLRRVHRELGLRLGARARVGRIRAEIVCVSRDRRTELRVIHRPTGAPIVILPTTLAYRWIDRRMAYPYGTSLRQSFAQQTEPRGRRRLLMEVARQAGPYLATPPVRLARASRRSRWQAILCQEYEYPRFDVSVLLGRALGVPVFGVFQGGVHQYGGLERALRPRAIARSAGLIIGPERELERAEAAYGLPADRIARIVNPVDLEVWRPGDGASARAELDLPADALVLAWHGRIAIHHKGLDVLLAAWREIAATHPGELRLLMIGGGSDSEEVDRLIGRMGLEGVVRVDRHIHDPELLSRYLSAADAYALASRYEGFPVALVEAMACGLPVVATDVAGAADIVGVGDEAAGVVVPAGDPDALAAALGALLDDDAERKRLAQHARSRAEARFSLAAVGAQLRELIAAAAPATGRGASA